MKTISIAHSKGGTGKSTLVLNLAPLFKDLIIIDLDTQSSVSVLNGIRSNKHTVFTAKNESELFGILDKYESTHNILIDCGGIDSDMNRLAISNSDLVISPVKDNSFEYFAFNRFIDVIDQIRDTSNTKVMAYAVINNVYPQTKDFSRLAALIDESKNITLLNTIIRQRADFANHLEYGTTCQEENENLKASIEIKNLFNEIQGL